MTGSDQIFSSRFEGGGTAWIGKCFLMVCIVGVGAAIGKLSITCIGLILVFTLFRAVIPYFNLVNELRNDRCECRLEREALMEIPTNDLAELIEIDNDEDGSVMKMARLAALSSDQMTVKQIWETFSSSYDSYWDSKMGPLQDSADQAPVLGLAGSLLGIVAALSALGSGAADNNALFEAMSTMALTTLVGGGAYVLISGLYRDAFNQVESHRSDLLFIAKNMNGNHGGEVAGGPTVSDDDNPFDLFSKALNGGAA